MVENNDKYTLRGAISNFGPLYAFSDDKIRMYTFLACCLNVHAIASVEYQDIYCYKSEFLGMDYTKAASGFI